MEMLEKGTRLARYEIEKKLGRGSTGTVYVARDTVLGERVALKVLGGPQVGSEEAFVRFTRELVLARRVSHPGICRVFDIHDERGVRFITMEYLPGLTLDELLLQEERLSPSRAVWIVRQICRALRAAHKAGIVHRDLKPSNIMIGPGDKATLLDFGFATASDLGRLTRTHIVVGTPHYIAPELLSDQPATSRSDLFALGVLFYRALTGLMPFTGEDWVAILRKAIETQAIPPSRVVAAVPPELDTIVLKCLAADPEQRWADAGLIEAALEQLASRLPPPEVVDAFQISPWDRDIDSTVRAASDAPSTSELIAQRRRMTTILFCDIVGITPYFEAHGDVAGRKRIAEWTRIVTPVVREHDGVIVKTIGDAVMASFLLAHDGVAAGLAIQDAVRRHRAASSDPAPLRVRVGLHCGDAIVERRDIFGDTVNVAARITTAAAPDQVLVSAAVRATLGDELEARSLGMVELKGKAGLHELFEVTRLEGTTSRLRLRPSGDDTKPSQPTMPAQPPFASPELGAVFGDQASGGSSATPRAPAGPAQPTVMADLSSSEREMLRESLVEATVVTQEGLYDPYPDQTVPAQSAFATHSEQRNDARYSATVVTGVTTSVSPGRWMVRMLDLRRQLLHAMVSWPGMARLVTWWERTDQRPVVLAALVFGAGVGVSLWLVLGGRIGGDPVAPASAPLEIKQVATSRPRDGRGPSARVGAVTASVALERLRAGLAAKGLVQGDDERFDRALASLQAAASSGSAMDLGAELEDALRTLDAVRIDRPFMVAKLKRLSREAASVQDVTVRRQGEALLRRAQQELGRIDLASANRSANEAAQLFRDALAASR